MLIQMVGLPLHSSSVELRSGPVLHWRTTNRRESGTVRNGPECRRGCSRVRGKAAYRLAHLHSTTTQPVERDIHVRFTNQFAHLAIPNWLLEVSPNTRTLVRVRIRLSGIGGCASLKHGLMRRGR